MSQILAQKRSEGDSVVHTPNIAFRHLKDVVNQCLEFECGVDQCPSVPPRGSPRYKLSSLTGQIEPTLPSFLLASDFGSRLNLFGEYAALAKSSTMSVTMVFQPVTVSIVLFCRIEWT